MVRLAAINPHFGWFLSMVGVPHQSSRPISAVRPPVWRHPAVFWTSAFLLVLLLVQLVTYREVERESEPVRTAPSPSLVGAEAQRPSSTEIPVTPAEPQSMAAEVEAPGRTFIAKLNLQPRLVNGQVKGFVVRPEDPSILKGTPLQSGDVLLEVDGLELDPARAALLAKSVGDYQDVFVRFERGNAEQEGMLPLGTR